MSQSVLQIVNQIYKVLTNQVDLCIDCSFVSGEYGTQMSSIIHIYKTHIFQIIKSFFSHEPEEQNISSLICFMLVNLFQERKCYSYIYIQKRVIKYLEGIM